MPCAIIVAFFFMDQYNMLSVREDCKQGACTPQKPAFSLRALPIQVHSPQELQDQLRKNDGKLVVLMCKAASCRPCKVGLVRGEIGLISLASHRAAGVPGAKNFLLWQMFARKYQRIAAEHSVKGAVFLEIMGDETLDTRVRIRTLGRTSLRTAVIVNICAVQPCLCKDDVVVPCQHAFWTL